MRLRLRLVHRVVQATPGVFELTHPPGELFGMVRSGIVRICSQAKQMAGGAQQPPQFLPEFSQRRVGGFSFDNLMPFPLSKILTEVNPNIEKLQDNRCSSVPNLARGVQCYRN